MQLFQKARRKLGEYFLKKQLEFNKRNISFHNFENTETIGILFNATKAEDFELVKKYHRYLKGLNKKVKALGFFTSKELPDISYSKAEYDFFALKGLNWHLKPMGGFIDNFIQEEFDVLIDLNLANDFPLKYVAALSKARFKIGPYSPNTQIYDLMFEISEGQGIKYFLKHLDHYLLQINQNLKPAAS